MIALLGPALLLLSRAAAAATLQATVLDASGAPVQDAVVFVYGMKTTAARKPREYVMDQIDKELVPHVLPVPAGSFVRFPNKDNIHHSLYSFSPTRPFELPLYKGEAADPIRFDKPGVVKLGCNIHDWMSGIILVLENPYFAKTDARGRAALPLPRNGDVQVAVFHERLAEPVEDTRQSARAPREEDAGLTWRLALRPARSSKRPAAASYR